MDGCMTGVLSDVGVVMWVAECRRNLHSTQNILIPYGTTGSHSIVDCLLYSNFIKDDLYDVTLPISMCIYGLVALVQNTIVQQCNRSSMYSVPDCLCSFIILF